jgi:hypothetical protein
MNCLEFEQKLGTDPERLNAEAQHHAAHCADCQRKLLESQRFEATLRGAFGDGRPHLAERKVMPPQLVLQQITRRRFALGGAAAASIAAVVVAQRMTVSDLPDELISHISTASLGVESPLPTTVVSDVLKSARVMLNNDALEVTYANNCLVWDHITAHLVLQGKSGPMTAFLMPAVATDAVAIFERTPWTGRISPYQGGSIAVLGFNQNACAETEDRLRQAVHFQHI